MLRAFRKRRFGILFSIAAGLMASLAGAPARAADLELPTDAKILKALKAKRLTRCPHAPARPRCGGARLQFAPVYGEHYRAPGLWISRTLDQRVANQREPE
jgi:hypothetical protein